MALIIIENLLKQEGNRTVLKNIDLIIEEKSKIGVKMSSEESKVLFELILGNLIPSSGHIRKETNSILVENKDDDL
ncbi:hypothetical protein CD30_03755 [Ureibacillus massiliensis 4400831 = CIP 108448 = CCUG 49529]|uniref:Uncharacterized protein n=1 Tax=Ureibacillus massiliensis 4400831 = CIP 108448 = CCUG 49529 TaxID=1211035 RepID=A0A0A3J951_9BACL|nr:hypothetical protein [Ureibacillus massiliensis]KGR91703.1 hypothetical protein CD30_03755 [Ureibacillus massiliensis 4400831 = CIP 108448 = CCUG 49529]